MQFSLLQPIIWFHNLKHQADMATLCIIAWFMFNTKGKWWRWSSACNMLWRHKGKVEAWLHLFFNLDAQQGWVVKTMPRVALPPGRRSGTHFTGGRVLDGNEEIRIRGNWSVVLTIVIMFGMIYYSDFSHPSVYNKLSNTTFWNQACYPTTANSR
jgi:hypothetical protein